MAKAKWLEVSPSQGSGNATINVSSTTEHTGRTPSLETASPYEKIDKEHDGTLEDPIPYAPPMEIFIDKYYIENSIIYRCIRDSEIVLTHSLNSLVGLYVEAL